MAELDGGTDEHNDEISTVATGEDGRKNICITYKAIDEEKPSSKERGTGTKNKNEGIKVVHLKAIEDDTKKGNK